MRCKLLITAMLMSAASSFCYADELVKVAILDIVDRTAEVPYGQKLLLRGCLTTGVSRTPGYEGYDRVDMSGIFGEQDFQRTGLVSDDQIHKLGEMTGASFVLVAEAAPYDAGNLVVTAKILNVETAKITNSSESICPLSPPETMREKCVEMVISLLGITDAAHSGGRTTIRPIALAPAVPNYADYTETAYGMDLEMVYVAGGEFLMGGTSEQGSDADSDESVIRHVTVGDFYIGRYEVTQSQWESVMGTSVSQQRNKVVTSNYLYGTGPNYPMCYVSWEEANEFCRILSRKTGRNYRLPTEAEWEYAARGGEKSDGTKYSGSNLIDYAGWYNENCGSLASHSVGTKSPNGLDIYDMSGNVYEWCQDWYGDSYDRSQTDNPTGPASGSSRVIRGGGWFSKAAGCRVSYRSCDDPGSRDDDCGFRVVRLP